MLIFLSILYIINSEYYNLLLRKLKVKLYLISKINLIFLEDNNL